MQRCRHQPCGSDQLTNRNIQLSDAPIYFELSSGFFLPQPTPQRLRCSQRTGRLCASSSVSGLRSERSSRRLCGSSRTRLVTTAHDYQKRANTHRPERALGAYAPLRPWRLPGGAAERRGWAWNVAVAPCCVGRVGLSILRHPVFIASCEWSPLCALLRSVVAPRPRRRRTLGRSLDDLSFSALRGPRGFVASRNSIQTILVLWAIHNFLFTCFSRA